jgi:hypothetical protein
VLSAAWSIDAGFARILKRAISNSDTSHFQQPLDKPKA